MRGSTALWDAIGNTINKISRAREGTIEAERAAKVMVVIATDGMENASREFRNDKVREMIDLQREKHGWEFVFIGANIDSFEVADGIGIGRDMTANYVADSTGMNMMFCCISRAVSDARIGKSRRSNWKKELETDYEERSKKQ